MAKGTIRRLIADRGFGFIKTEQEEDLFFHRNELQEVDYDSLTEGQQVEFEIEQGRGGRPQAVRVRLTETQSGDDVGEIDAGGDGGGDGGVV